MHHVIEVKKAGTTAIFELEQKCRTFKVLGARVLDRPDLHIGFDPQGVEEDLDTSSDVKQVFNISTSVRVSGCLLNTTQMRAPDEATLRLALNRVKLRFWNPEEI